MFALKQLRRCGYLFHVRSTGAATYQLFQLCRWRWRRKATASKISYLLIVSAVAAMNSCCSSRCDSSKKLPSWFHWCVELHSELRWSKNCDCADDKLVVEKKLCLPFAYSNSPLDLMASSDGALILKTQGDCPNCSLAQRAQDAKNKPCSFCQTLFERLPVKTSRWQQRPEKCRR